MDEDNLFRFDLWLYDEMNKRDLNATDVAEMADLSLHSIYGYLHNRTTPRLGSLALILKAFGKHIEIVDD